ncbi:MAG: hypothetical protein IJS08_11630 [Victivallales bacterium]|nr:hypothetical protein [Victivallales bacterium]
MKKLFLLLIAFIAVIFLFGCSTTPRVEGATVLSKDGSRQVNLAGGSNEVPATVEVLANAKDLLRIAIVGKGKGEAAGLSSSIVEAVKGGMAADVARVVERAYDMKVMISTELELVDVDGEYRRLNALVKVSIVSPDGNRTYGTNAIRLKGVRKLGAAAVSQFEAPASEVVLKWLKDSIMRIVQEDIDVAVITFKLPRPALSLEPVGELDAANVKAIGGKLNGMKGVMKVDCIMQNVEAATCGYRLLYRRGTYPYGIVNEAALLVREIAR